ncbi:MAG: 2-dehydropantoate 2-reductase, partial [Lachnospiraceae bacterium]|nr:2-dehydropantoate 2-reductase [Lachnospiraceae bacterium]
MVIAIIGIGGVGGYFGGKLTRILNMRSAERHEIYFVARGEHGRKIKEKGLLLKTNLEGEMICRPTQVLESIAELPLIDICFVCVKQYDLCGCLTQLKTKVKSDTKIIPLLNGVDIYERIREVIPNGYVFPACVYVGTHIEAPGIVAQDGGSCEIVFGKDKKYGGEKPDEICRLMTQAGIRYRWSESYLEEICSKYIFIAAYGLVTASENKTLGEVYENTELRNKVKRIMKEIVRLGEAENIAFSEDIVQISLEKAKSFPYETKTSFQRDFETPEIIDERDLFGSTLLKIGAKHNVVVSEIR